MAKQPVTALTPDVAWVVASASDENAERLIKSAEVLYDAGHYGPAMSLSISACEELGKFLMGVMVGVGLSAPDRLMAIRRGHGPKQAFGVVVSRAGAVIDLMKSALADLADLRGTTPEDLIAVLNERMAAAVHALVVPEGIFDDVVSESEAAFQGTLELNRQRGLYVDFLDTSAGWKIQSPREVSANEARAQIDQVQGFFGIGKAVTDLIKLDPAVMDIPVPDGEGMRVLLADFASKLWAPKARSA